MNDIPEKKKKKKIIFIVIGLVLLFLACITSFIYFIIMKPQQPRSWDETTVISTEQQIASQYFIYKVGCDPLDCGDGGAKIPFFGNLSETTSVSLYGSIDEYSKYLSNTLTKDQQELLDGYNSIVLVDQKELNLNTYIDALEKEQPQLRYYLRDSVMKMIQEGKVVVIDSEGNVQDKITYRDRGMICGPLCGEGSSWFELEDGGIFLIESQWIS